MPKKAKTSKRTKEISPSFPLKYDLKAATEGISSALNLTSNSSALRRQQHRERLNDLIESVLTMESDNFIHQNSSELQLDNFPILQVGFVARALGLNLTDKQIEHIIELIQDSNFSTEYVSRKLLEEVILEALATGILGGPVLVEKGIVKELKHPPTCCIREDEERIFQAFCTLDSQKKGYLEDRELRALLESKGEIMSTKEIDTMLTALVDKEGGLIDYKELASILAHE
ncbi:unnamed protein product [Phytomonas sp. Hart1]|nr:unnamed protein product [Phytomonas sp. Hart1]|eukprot:CCW66168.1 unnamed protein product [Phytomonas sp. isolate Hart1]